METVSVSICSVCPFGKVTTEPRFINNLFQEIPLNRNVSMLTIKYLNHVSEIKTRVNISLKKKNTCIRAYTIQNKVGLMLHVQYLRTN